MKLLQRLVVEEKGQGITEYALILGLVVFGIWLLVTQSGIGAAINKDRKSTRLNSSHIQKSRMPSSA